MNAERHVCWTDEMSRLTPPNLARLISATHQQLDVVEWFSHMGLHRQIGLMQVRRWRGAW